MLHVKFLRHNVVFLLKYWLGTWGWNWEIRSPVVWQCKSRPLARWRSDMTLTLCYQTAGVEQAE